jgi:hypothetical protein
MRSARCALLLALALVLDAAPSRGNETDDAVAQMRFREGTRKFHDRNYAGALDDFKRGHQLSKRPIFLYNIALSYENLGDLENAEEYFKTFLFKYTGRDGLVSQARDHLEKVQQERVRQAQARVQARKEGPEIVTPSLLSVPEPQPLPTTPSPLQPPAPRRRIFTGLSGALAVAALGTAIGLEVWASSDFDGLKNSCAPNCTHDMVDPLGTKLNAATGLFVTAGVLAIAAVVLYFVEGRPRVDTSIARTF